MSKERLADLLHQLQVELSETDDLDQATGDQLRAASAEIRLALDRDETDPEAQGAPQGVIQQLREATERFEDSHPTLTNTVGRIADALAQLGI